MTLLKCLYQFLGERRGYRFALVCQDVQLRIDCYFGVHMEYKRPDGDLKIPESTLASACVACSYILYAPEQLTFWILRSHGLSFYILLLLLLCLKNSIQFISIALKISCLVKQFLSFPKYRNSLVNVVLLQGILLECECPGEANSCGPLPWYGTLLIVQINGYVVKANITLPV